MIQQPLFLQQSCVALYQCTNRRAALGVNFAGIIIEIETLVKTPDLILQGMHEFMRVGDPLQPSKSCLLDDVHLLYFIIIKTSNLFTIEVEIEVEQVKIRFQKSEEG